MWTQSVILFILIFWTSKSQAWIQQGKIRDSSDGVLVDFDEEDLRFNDYENRLEDSFFKYVARSDDYDRNEVPWENGDKPVQVKMSAYLRKVHCVEVTNNSWNKLVNIWEFFLHCLFI